MLANAIATSMSQFADVSAAVTAMQNYVTPTIKVLASLASIACVFFIVNAGYLYITSSGKPEQLDHAKHILKNALIGLIIVFAAFTLTSILSGAYGTPHGSSNATLPNLQAIQPNTVSNGLVDVLINAVTGFLNNIIQAIAAPFLSALNFFTKSTPLMAENSSVFNLWLAMVGITDVLFVVVLALIGFHVMSAASLGFDEIEFKHLLPRIALVFLLINSSIFFIDGIIAMSNALITAVGKISGASSVWDTLTAVVKEAGGQGLAALLLMMAFLVLSVVLLVYYVLRLVALYIGAVLSPVVMLAWLVPGFRDFAETALKTYITLIFNLFVHVVVLLLAASLFTGMATASGDNKVPDTFMAMIVGLATILTLLKTQSVMMQFSYVSMGARNMRKIGGQFMNGVSYMTGRSVAVANKTVTAVKNRAVGARSGSTSSSTSKKATSASTTNGPVDRSGEQKVKVRRVPENQTTKTGTTYEAPQVTTTESIKSKATSNKGKKS